MVEIKQIIESDIVTLKETHFQFTQKPTYGQPEIIAHHYNALDTAAVAVPQTGLAAETLSTEGPTIETGEAASDAAEEVAVEVPQTGLAAGTLSTEGPMIESGSETYVIKAGDTYWALAREFYGDANMWTKLDEANPDLMAEALEIGTEINVPAP